jgi:hypothetical protein
MVTVPVIVDAATAAAIAAAGDDPYHANDTVGVHLMLNEIYECKSLP